VLPVDQFVPQLVVGEGDKVAVRPPMLRLQRRTHASSPGRHLAAILPSSAGVSPPEVIARIAPTHTNQEPCISAQETRHKKRAARRTTVE
jgi:hypothetical protein